MNEEWKVSKKESCPKGLEVPGHHSQEKMKDHGILRLFLEVDESIYLLT